MEKDHTLGLGKREEKSETLKVEVDIDRECDENEEGNELLEERIEDHHNSKAAPLKKPHAHPEGEDQDGDSDDDDRMNNPNAPRPPKQKLEYFEWTPEIQSKSKEAIEAQKETLSERVYSIHEKDARKYWDIFYKRNTTNFYKNRNYIDREMGLAGFIEQLKPVKKRRLNFLEAGCGVGNTLFPICDIYKQDMKTYGFDFSDNAIRFIKQNEHYNTENMEVEVKDLVKSDLSHYKNMDFVTLVFVLSAISPENHEMVMAKLFNAMDDNSYLYIRDYAEYDMAQLRLAKKQDSKLKDNFYLKSDGTRVFYFSESYLRELFGKFPEIKITMLETHYRRIRNIKRNLEMHRVWIQGTVHKSSSHALNPPNQTNFEVTASNGG